MKTLEMIRDEIAEKTGQEVEIKYIYIDFGANWMANAIVCNGVQYINEYDLTELEVMGTMQERIDRCIESILKFAKAGK